MRKEIVFLATGFCAGVLTVLIGTGSVTFLAVGVGALFFTAVLAAIAITHSWSFLRPGYWRYIVGLAISTTSYVLGLFTFSTVGGFAPQLFGVSESTNITQFRADVWIGLIAADLVSSYRTNGLLAHADLE